MTPETLSKLGFYFGSSGAHAGRSLMLDDLVTLLDHVPAMASNKAYTTAIMDANVLAKATVNNRDHAARRMRQLYGLDAGNCLFRNFRRLWDWDLASRPVLALLLAVARDALLRSTENLITRSAPGQVLSRDAFKGELDRFGCGRFSEEVLKHAAANVARTWTEAGYLKGEKEKVRIRPALGTAACAFALFLGWLEGAQGQLLFRTRYAQLLDRPIEELISLATDASRQGMLELLNAGGVVEIRFPGFLTEEEARLP